MMASIGELAFKEAKENERVRVLLEVLLHELDVNPSGFDVTRMKAEIEKILKGGFPVR